MLDLNQFTGYTPGPWKWARRYSDGENKPIAVLLETEHRPIKWNDPVVSAIREDWIDMFIDNTPNASLIAAAPELLVACKQLRADLDAALAFIRDNSKSIRRRNAVLMAMESLYPKPPAAPQPAPPDTQ